jgi:hypothetical protein
LRGWRQVLFPAFYKDGPVPKPGGTGFGAGPVVFKFYGFPGTKGPAWPDFREGSFIHKATCFMKAETFLTAGC